MSINISDNLSNYLPYYGYEILIHFTWLPVRTGLMDIVFYGRFWNNLHIVAHSQSKDLKTKSINIQSLWWSNCVLASSVVAIYRSWILQVSARSNRLKSKTIKLVIVAYLHKHQGEKAKTGWFKIRIMCWCEATRLSAHYCLDMLVQNNRTSSSYRNVYDIAERLLIWH